MAKANYSMIMVVLAFAAAASMANCTFLVPISQAIVTTTQGLTCSTPSPRLRAQALSGANVTATCNGATNSTATDASGFFRLVLNFPTATTPASVITGCRVLVTVPSNCTITYLFRRVTTLRSTLLALVFVDSSVPSGSATFRPVSFVRLA